jgi:hypothetical protein
LKGCEFLGAVLDLGLRVGMVLSVRSGVFLSEWVPSMVE